MISGRNPPISSRMSPHPHPHSHDQLRPPSAEPPPLPFPLVRSVGGCARRSLSRERSCYIRRSAKVTEDAGRMSKAVSKAPYSGQVTSAPQPTDADGRTTDADGGTDAQVPTKPARTRTVCATAAPPPAAAATPKPSWFGAGESLPSPPPQPTQRCGPSAWDGGGGGAMRGKSET